MAQQWWHENWNTVTELTLYLTSGHVPVVSFIFLHWYFVTLNDVLSYSFFFAWQSNRKSLINFGQTLLAASHAEMAAGISTEYRSRSQRGIPRHKDFLTAWIQVSFARLFRPSRLAYRESTLFFITSPVPATTFMSPGHERLFFGSDSHERYCVARFIP